MTWADFASRSPWLAWAVVFSSLGLVWYVLVTIRHAILARYHLETAAQRTTQEEYLVDLLCPVLEESRCLGLDDPVCRKALARVLAARIVTGG